MFTKMQRERADVRFVEPGVNDMDEDYSIPVTVVDCIVNRVNISIDLVTSRKSRSLSLVRSRVARQWMRFASRRDIRRTLSMGPAAPPDDARAPAWEDDDLSSPSAPSPSPEAEGRLDIELHWWSIA